MHSGQRAGRSCRGRRYDAAQSWPRKLPWATVIGTDAADRTRQSPAIRGQTCRTDRGCPPVEGRAGPLVAHNGNRGPPAGGGLGEPPATTEGTRVPPAGKGPWECLFSKVRRGLG